MGAIHCDEKRGFGECMPDDDDAGVGRGVAGWRFIAYSPKRITAQDRHRSNECVGCARREPPKNVKIDFSCPIEKSFPIGG